MHSLVRHDKDTWNVVRCEIGAGGETNYYALFAKLSFGTAVRICNCLNGGEMLSGDLLKVVEQCTA